MFRKPQKSRIGGKFLVSGATHEGKSWFGLTFPKIGAIDSEVGLAFEEGNDIEISGNVYNNLEFVDTTADLDTLEENLEAIIDGEVEIETLLIDSETKFYNAMDIGATEVEERKAKQAGKNVDNRAKWGRVKNINTKMQQAKLTCSAKGIHVVSTAQEKDVKDKDNNIIGYVPDVQKTLPFDYDVILRFYTELDKKTKERRFYAEVIKDRTHVTKKGDIIENCTYDVWKPYFDGRNGKGSKLSGANFSKDLKNSTASVLNNAELSEKLATDIKDMIKNGDKDNIAKIKAKINEMEINIKEMDCEEPKKLQQLMDYIKSL